MLARNWTPLVTLPSRTSRHGMIRFASILSAAHPAEVDEQLEAGRAALFEVELSGDDVVARNRGGERQAVVARANRERRIVGNRIVRIDEIEVRVVGHAGEDSMGARLAHAVPSDLRNLERTAVERARITGDAAGDDAEAFGGVLFTAIEQHLDADADAEERLAGAGDVVAQHVDESERAQIFHGGAGGADAGEDDAIGGGDALGAIGYFGLMTEKFERALNAGQVAGFVVNDCYHGRIPNRRS